MLSPIPEVALAQNGAQNSGAQNDTFLEGSSQFGTRMRKLLCYVIHSLLGNTQHFLLAKHKVTLQAQNGEDHHVTEEMAPVVHAHLTKALNFV